MPAEWEPHEATWIAWPHNHDDWPGRFEPIPWVYGEIVRKLSQVERVRILVQNDDVETSRAHACSTKCGAQWEAVEFYPAAHRPRLDPRLRPLFVKNAAGRGGRRQMALQRLGQIRKPPARRSGRARHSRAGGRRLRGGPDMVLEGGSIDVNGAGLLLTTEECLLSPVQARNPGSDRASEIETALGDYLGIDRVLWLHNGIAGDDTHGHVDDLARFADPDTVVIVSEDDRSDANYAAAARKLENPAATIPCACGSCPCPRRCISTASACRRATRISISPTRLVLVPTFNDPNDRIALNMLAECFPDREVIGINCVELVWGLGTLHCMTQQQPASDPLVYR